MATATVDDRAVQGLIDGYTKQVALYRSMLEITQMQSEGLKRDGDVREFVSLLRKKDDIIRSIDKLETGLQPLKRAWQETPADARKALTRKSNKLNGLLDDVIMLIEKIIRKERGNERVLQTRRDRLGDDIRQLDKGRRLHRAFAARPAPRFVDARS